MKVIAIKDFTYKEDVKKNQTLELTKDDFKLLEKLKLVKVKKEKNEIKEEKEEKND